MNIQAIIDREQEPVKSFFRKMFAKFPSSGQVDLLRVPAGRLVCNQDDRAQYVYVLLEGQAVATGQQPQGYNYVISEFSAVHFFGEFETIGRLDSYIAAIVAKTDCRLIRFSPDVYLNWLKNDPDQAFDHFCDIIGSLLDQLLRERMNLFMDARERLTSFLADYYAENACAEDDVIPVRMTRMDISDSTGYAVRTVNRKVRSLGEQGLICVKNGKILISRAQYQRLKAELSACL